jgi:hypothetical protein
VIGRHSPQTLSKAPLQDVEWMLLNGWKRATEIVLKVVVHFLCPRPDSFPTDCQICVVKLSAMPSTVHHIYTAIAYILFRVVLVSGRWLTDLLKFCSRYWISLNSLPMTDAVQLLHSLKLRLHWWTKQSGVRRKYNYNMPILESVLHGPWDYF